MERTALQAPLPNETARLAALAALDILDTMTEDVYDSFVRVACDLLGAPIGAVSFVDQNRVWFKAIQGIEGVSAVPREVGFCSQTIADPSRPLCVPDLSKDARFRDNPLVNRKDGMRFYAGAPLVDQNGHALGALCVIDYEPRQPSPEMLSRLQDLATGVSAALRLRGTLITLDAEANRDALTRLGNRRAFARRLEASGGAPGWTLMLIDLDGFKSINDVFGHPAGDTALREVAERLRTAVRQVDEVFRLGGDEFAVLLPSPLGQADTAAIASRMHEALAAPFAIDNADIPLRASIGVAVQDAAHRAMTQGVVALADSALYEAKRAGRATTRFALQDAVATASGPSHPMIGPRLDLETRLRQALIPAGLEPFTLAFQPVTDIRQGVVTGFESLIRWNPTGSAPLPPCEFIPLGERSGLAAHLDRWVLQQACLVAAGWSRPWRIAVNISAVTFGIADLVAMVADALAQSGLAPGRLMLEMTETALAADEARVRLVVERLLGMGVRVALDDFGGGHGSLRALRRYPFSCIKIDRGLVAGMDDDPVSAKTVGFIAELGGLVGLEVIAEGVERPEELIALDALGIHCMQGYLLSQPVAAAGIEAAARRAEQVAKLRPSHDPLSSLGSSKAWAASTTADRITTNTAEYSTAAMTIARSSEVSAS